MRVYNETISPYRQSEKQRQSSKPTLDEKFNLSTERPTKGTENPDSAQTTKETETINTYRKEN